MATSVKSIGVGPQLQAALSDRMMELNLGLSTASKCSSSLSHLSSLLTDLISFYSCGLVFVVVVCFPLKKNVVLVVLALAMETRLVLNSREPLGSS